MHLIEQCNNEKFNTLVLPSFEHLSRILMFLLKYFATKFKQII